MPLDTYEGFPRMNKIDVHGPNPRFCPFNTVARYEPLQNSVPRLPEPLFDPLDDTPVVYESSMGWMEP